MLSTHLYLFGHYVYAQKPDDALNYADTIKNYLIKTNEYELWPLVSSELLLTLQILLTLI